MFWRPYSYLREYRRGCKRFPAPDALRSRTFQLARPRSNALNANTSPPRRAIRRGLPYTASRTDNSPGQRRFAPVPWMSRTLMPWAYSPITILSMPKGTLALAHDLRFRGTGAIAGNLKIDAACLGHQPFGLHPLRLLPDPRPPDRRCRSVNIWGPTATDPTTPNKRMARGFQTLEAGGRFRAALTPAGGRLTVCSD